MKGLTVTDKLNNPSLWFLSVHTKQTKSTSYGYID